MHKYAVIGREKLHCTHAAAGPAVQAIVATSNSYQLQLMQLLDEVCQRNASHPQNDFDFTKTVPAGTSSLNQPQSPTCTLIILDLS